MQAIILAGGAGTRLRSLYDDRPKILVPIGGRPFLEWQLEWLGRNGIDDIHIAAGYKADVLMRWLQTHQAGPSGKDGLFTIKAGAWSFTITMAIEPSPLGTGGGLKFNEPWIRSDPFLMVNGDSLVPHLDVRSFGETHRQSGLQATLAVTWIQDATRYGTVQMDTAQRITRFAEKAASASGWVNGGAYLINRGLLGTVSNGIPISLETDVFPHCIARNQLGSHTCPPPLLDMGTPNGIKEMEGFLATGVP